MKQQAFAGNARAKTGPAPLNNPFGPSVFNRCLSTSVIPLYWPAGAEKCFREKLKSYIHVAKDSKMFVSKSQT